MLVLQVLLLITTTTRVYIYIYIYLISRILLSLSKGVFLPFNAHSNSNGHYNFSHPFFSFSFICSTSSHNCTQFVHSSIYSSFFSLVVLEVPYFSFPTWQQDALASLFLVAITLCSKLASLFL